MTIGSISGCSVRARDATPWTSSCRRQRHRSLHIGHALDITLQDPHAARADAWQGRAVGGRHRPCRDRHEMVVERNLASQGVTGPASAARHSSSMCGVEGTVGGAITRQLRRLGASCDWANERFTMDDGFRRAVTHALSSCTAGPRLSRQAPGQLGPKFRPPSATSRSRTREVQASSGPCATRLPTGRAMSSRPTRPETCSPIWWSRSIQTTSAIAQSSASKSSCRLAAG